MAFLLSDLINSPRLLAKYINLTNKFVDDGILKEEEATPFVIAIEAKLQSSDWDETRKWFEQQEEQTTQDATTTTSLMTTTEFTAPTLGATSTLSTSIRIIAICLTIKTIVM